MLFKRIVELIVDGKKYEYPHFTIYFRVNFDDDEDNNDARIEIYNLSSDTINNLKKDKHVILNAGYESDVGTIFTGTIDKVDVDRQMSVDKIATIKCTDREGWTEKPITKTYKEGSTASQIINDVLKQTGLAIGDIDLPWDKNFPNGRTVDSPPKTIIKYIAKGSGAKMHTNGGKIFIRPRDKGDELAFVLNNKTGLVESPERIDDEDKGWNVTSLLNHRVTVDSILKVKSKTANGQFRVRRGEHIADNNRFYTVMEVVE